MAAYTNPELDGLPSIHRSRPREVWKLEDSFREENASGRNIHELQDQLRSQREELRKRDDMIRDLTSTEARTWAVQDHNHCGIKSCPSARSELAALQTKVDNLHGKLREKHMELDAATDANNRLRCEVDRLREDNARHLALNAELSRQLDCCEATRGSYEAAQSRSSHSLTSLQEQCRIAQERVRSLEAQLSNSAENSRQEAGGDRCLEKRHSEFVNGLIYHLGCDCSADNLDGVTRRVSEMAQENAQLKARLNTQRQQAEDQEAEARANRETIQRLLAELSREQRASRQHQADHSEFKSESEKIKAERADMATQLQHVEERLSSRQKVLDATKAELQEKEFHLSKLQNEAQDLRGRAENAENQLATLLQSLASTLSSAFTQVATTEEAVKEKVRLLCRELKEQSESVSALEERARTVGKQLEAQYEQNREKEQQSRRSHTEFVDMRERLAALEGELAAGDVIRDGLRADVQKFYKYMQQLAETMRMDEVGGDIGFDMLGDALLARAQQLARLSEDATHDKQSVIYNLQRKLKTMKEQLESRDLHMDLLRRKMAQLEERAAGRMDVEKEKETESGRVRKLQKQLEKSQQQMEQARAEIVSLKAQLLECSNLKLTALEQDRELASMETSLQKLEGVRQKQAKRIAEMKSKSDSREKEHGERSTSVEETVGSLSSELRTTKQSLEDARRREHQLLELRAVVARMLGLDVESLAVPDYEIVNRLERLIQAHQTNAFTAFTAERAVQDMEGSFAEGVWDAQKTAIAAAGQQRPRSPCLPCRGSRRENASASANAKAASGKVTWQQRTRSVSPRRDSRKY